MLSLTSSVQGADVQDVVAVCDPPRAGLHKSVLQALLGCDKIRRLVFVSCNPDSLVQNATVLCSPPGERIDAAMSVYDANTSSLVHPTACTLRTTAAAVPGEAQDTQDLAPRPLHKTCHYPFTDTRLGFLVLAPSLIPLPSDNRSGSDRGGRGGRGGWSRQQGHAKGGSYTPFRPVKAVAVDLFPHTAHVEAVMLLER